MRGETIQEARDVVLQSSPVGREKETVMDLVMEANMMATLAARETWCAGVTTANSLEDIITREMTAVRSPLDKIQSRSLLISPTLPSFHQKVVQVCCRELVMTVVFQDRGVEAGTTRAGGDAAAPSSPVTRERETVTDLVMEDSMMETRAARES